MKRHQLAILGLSFAASFLLYRSVRTEKLKAQSEWPAAKTAKDSEERSVPQDRMTKRDEAQKSGPPSQPGDALKKGQNLTQPTAVALRESERLKSLVKQAGVASHQAAIHLKKTLAPYHEAAARGVALPHAELVRLREEEEPAVALAKEKSDAYFRALASFRNYFLNQWETRKKEVKQ